MTALPFVRSFRSALGVTVLPMLTMLTACGDSGAGGDSVGRGTRTLEVIGRVTAENVVDNASTATYFNSDFSVRVLQGGIDVVGATVTIDSEGGPITLTYNAGNNRYEGSQSGYYRTYSLDIVSGADSVTDVRVAGPDIHTITSPIGNEPIDASLGVNLEWDRSVIADGLEIDTDRDNFAAADTGTYQLPFSTFECDSSVARENRVEIERERRVIPEGAVGNSSFSVRIRNSHTFFVLPNPGC